MRDAGRASLRSLAAAAGLVSLVCGLAACGVARRHSLGGDCELTSECDTPLVCRLTYCRNECATSSDCTVGLSCVLDPSGLGACQLPEERTCALSSECPAPLVCRSRQCVNECAEDRDCLGGARCDINAEGGACIEPVTTACSLDSECAGGTFCLGGRCRPQCFTDRDCRNDWWCDVGASVCRPLPRPDSGVSGLADVGTAMDVGPADGSSGDAGALDGSSDGASGDAGSTDAGPPPPTTCMGGPLRNVIAFDVGRQHACAIVDDGIRRLVCWGSGSGYVFGTVGMTVASCATEILSLRGTDMVEVAVSASVTCVRSSTGVVSCLGENQSGELGRGTSGTGTSDAAPAPIPGLVARSIESGLGLYLCATRAGLLPQCWGDDGVMQLGDGPLCGCNRPSPVDSIEAAGASALYLGYAHTCFVTGTGGVDCFGEGIGAELDAGLALTGARSVAPGLRHRCVLTATGVSCWGQNVRGQLGDGTLADRATPALVLGLPSVPIEISAGDSHTCAVLASGELYCWGDGPGVNAMTHFGTYPTATYVMSGASAVSCGYNYTCALVGDRISCLGAERRHLGYGLGFSVSVPVEVQLP